MRLNITIKLMFFASFLLAIPMIGYNYIWDMEKHLRKGQEQTLMNNAKALATALHERENLFNNQASYKDALVKGKDFFPSQINKAIKLDGLDNDWLEQANAKSINRYNHLNQINSTLSEAEISLNFSSQIGRYKDYVYALLNVTDDQVLFRPKNALSVVENDHIEIATLDQNQEFSRYVISNHSAGWVSAFKMPAADIDAHPQNETAIQGQWQLTEDGYIVELRIKKALLGEKVGFSITDVDSFAKPIQKIVIGTADTQNSNDLGTLTVPSPKIESIIKAMGRSHSKIRVVDKHQQLLTEHGDIQNAAGDWSDNNFYLEKDTWFSQIRDLIINPFYQYFLTKPPKTFTIEQFENRRHKNRHVQAAINTGKLTSMWWTTNDNKAVILSAAHPIYVDNQVKGAVIVEETTHGIRSIRNKAVEGILLTSIFIYLSVAALFLYTLRLSFRIRKLRNQTEAVVDEQGKIKANLPGTKINDEIGDLSKSFTNIISQLGQYNNYLQHMSSRLSHELKTPISVVRSSLEMMENQQLPEDNQVYMKRAKNGINRLNSMLMAMSEATHLEQALATSESDEFDLAALVEGCGQSYQQIYQQQKFNLNITSKPIFINGCDEHIAQLFDKLISNAVEFSNNGDDIKVNLALDNSKKQVMLSIENKGALLPEKMQANIFDAMVSVRNEEQKKQPHLGIGLYICKLISDHHEGSIIAENLADNSGVRFILTLPIARLP
ncbi:proteobacterial dedicated sortase system histidine kinase [Thalassotalea fonticola]|uniref:histidine kinase n=1 Tax=Thalassotalea fonticola TaxID=3065649 RepID=A0ABZ0GN27_9GAMM|nr:proteobacterial dedicated sortase system histidine kinase [Colwelliaceae bacterium S1-1]